MRNHSVARTSLLAVALLVVVAACGGGAKVGGDSGTTPTTKGGSSIDCEGKTLTAPEIGVSEDTITVTVIADTGSPVRPGLFQDSVDGVEAWADYINDNGGLACRRVAVIVDGRSFGMTNTPCSASAPYLSRYHWYWVAPTLNARGPSPL